MSAPLTRAQLDEVYIGILTYYTEKVLRHGATPQGVDWSDAKAQGLRFAQLLKLCNFSVGFALNDVGCGYGALLAYLEKRHADARIDFLGVDLSSAMIREAKRMWGSRPDAKFVVGNVSPRSADYSVASGIFNVKLGEPRERWEQFIAHTLANLRATSRLGFAVNFKVGNGLGRRSRPGLYVTTPQRWIRYCEQTLGWSVEFIQDYSLREFTLLVRP